MFENPVSQEQYEEAIKTIAKAVVEESTTLVEGQARGTGVKADKSEILDLALGLDDELEDIRTAIHAILDGS